VTLEEIEQKLVQEIDAGIAEGFKLGPFHAKLGDRCCAVGMLVRNSNIDTNTNRIESAANILGITVDDAFHIAMGFDSGIKTLDDPYSAIGVKLHDKYLQTKAE
jgi:hypothetical protein